MDVLWVFGGKNAQKLLQNPSKEKREPSKKNMRNPRQKFFLFVSVDTKKVTKFVTIVSKDFLQFAAKILQNWCLCGHPIRLVDGKKSRSSASRSVLVGYFWIVRSHSSRGNRELGAFLHCQVEAMPAYGIVYRTLSVDPIDCCSSWPSFQNSRTVVK